MEGYGGALPPYVAEWMAEVRNAGGKVPYPCPSDAEQAAMFRAVYEETKAKYLEQQRRRQEVARKILKDELLQESEKQAAEMRRRVAAAVELGQPVGCGPDGMPRKITLKAILETVSRKHNIPVDEIVSRRRTRRVAHARQEFYYYARKFTTHSMPRIAQECDRDHTTVLHGIRRYAERMGLPMPEDAR